MYQLIQKCLSANQFHVDCPQKEKQGRMKDYLVTENHIVLLSTQKHQVESYINHTQVGTDGMEVAKHTGGQPVANTLHGQVRRECF